LNADPEEDKKMRALFKATAGDDEEVDAYELQNILNTTYTQGAVTD